MTSTVTTRTEDHLRDLRSIRRRLDTEGICTDAVDAALLALARPAVSSNLVAAARTLLDACVQDFGEPDDRNDELRDDGAVALSAAGPVAVTFAMMRDLGDALAGVEAGPLTERAEMVAELALLREAEEVGNAKVAWSYLSAAASRLDGQIRALDSQASPTTSPEVTS